MRKSSYNICRFYVSKNLENNPFYYFDTISNAIYDENKGWGFEDVTIDCESINATFLKKSPTYFYTWNDQTNSKEKISIMYMREIKLKMDFKHHILLVNGNNADMNSLKYGLRNLFWNTFIYDELTEKPIDLLKAFVKENIVEVIKEVSIENFEYLSILSGKLIAKNVDFKNAINYLLENGSNIERLVLQIIFNDNTIICTIKDNGRFSLQGNEDAKMDFIHYMVSKIS